MWSLYNLRRRQETLKSTCFAFVPKNMDELLQYPRIAHPFLEHLHITTATLPELTDPRSRAIRRRHAVPFANYEIALKLLMKLLADPLSNHKVPVQRALFDDVSFKTTVSYLNSSVGEDNVEKDYLVQHVNPGVRALVFPDPAGVNDIPREK